LHEVSSQRLTPDPIQPPDGRTAEHEEAESAWAVRGVNQTKRDAIENLRLASVHPSIQITASKASIPHPYLTIADGGSCAVSRRPIVIGAIEMFVVERDEQRQNSPVHCPQLGVSRGVAQGSPFTS